MTPRARIVLVLVLGGIMLLLIALVLLAVARHLSILSRQKQEWILKTYQLDKELGRVLHDSTLPANKVAVWCFWHDTSCLEKVPLLVKISILSWVKKNPAYRIRFLSEKTLPLFLDVPVELPLCFPNLSYQYKADAIRVALLDKYGGFWIDASILCFEQNFLDRWMRDDRVQFGAYESNNPLLLPLDTPTVLPLPLIENWFLFSRHPKYPLLTEWKDRVFHVFQEHHGNFGKYLRKVRAEGVPLNRIMTPFHILLIPYVVWEEMLFHSTKNNNNKSMMTKIKPEELRFPPAFGYGNPCHFIIQSIFNPSHPIQLVSRRPPPNRCSSHEEWRKQWGPMVKLTRYIRFYMNGLWFLHQPASPLEDCFK